MAVTAENIDPDVAVKTAEELGVVLEQEKVQREIVKQKVCQYIYPSTCALFHLSTLSIPLSMCPPACPLFCAIVFICRASWQLIVFTDTNKLS